MLRRIARVLFLGVGLAGAGVVLLLLAYSMLGQVVDSPSISGVELTPGDSIDLKANLVVGGVADIYVRAESPAQLKVQIFQPDGAVLREREFQTNTFLPIDTRTTGEHVAMITNLDNHSVVIGAVFTSSVAGPSSIWSSTNDAMLTGGIGGILLATGAIVLITCGVWLLLRRRNGNIVKS